MDNQTLDPLSRCPLTISTSGSAAKPEVVAADDVTTLLWAVCGPTVLVVGVVGNALILVTMAQRRMRGTSTCVYLSAMAVVDLMVLAAGLTHNWLEGAGYVTIQDLSPAACKLEKFLDYTTGDTAIWCRVAFTLDRLVAVSRPLYKGRACGQPMSARIYVMIACLLAVAKNAHVLVTRGAEYQAVAVSVCGPLDNVTAATHYQTTMTLVDVCGYTSQQYAYFERYVRPWLAFALVSAGPFVLIAVCNSLIVLALLRRRRNILHRLSNVQHEQQFVQLSIMCVAASALFLVCSLPSIIVLIGKPQWNVPAGQNSAYQVSKAVSNVLFYVTFSANFFLYCLTGRRFRSTLRHVLRCEDAAARPSRLLQASTWSQSRRQNVTSQRSTLTSSLTCATVTAVPHQSFNHDDSSRQLPQLHGSDGASLVDNNQHQLQTLTTAVTDHQQTDHTPADHRGH